MRCKQHPYHTGIGVCGTCLYDRLLPLVSPDKHSPNRTQDCSPSPPSLSPSSKSEGILFPRSVSPYLPAAFRKTNLHFFHTPQAVPTATCSTEEGPRKVKRRFFLYSLFGRSSKDKMKSNSSSSWLMYRFMWRGRRRKGHMDGVEPTRRCSTRAAMPAVNISPLR